MKKKQLLILLAIIYTCLISTSAEAKIWRVNNKATGTYGQNMGGTENYPVYKQLEEVNSSNIVVAGDTVHLEGSNDVYESVALTKKLIIIGAGYFLTEDAGNSSNGLQSQVLSLSFASSGTNTSLGSQLIGVYAGLNSNGISIYVSNITVKRCKTDYQIFLSSDISDIFIIQNYFTGASSAQTITTTSNGFPTHVIINNNIFRRNLVLPNNAAYTVEECKNNVFAGPTGTPGIRMYVNQFQNNIITNQNSTVILNGVTGPVNNPNISHNVSALASTQFGSGNNNTEASATTLFVNPATVTDNGFQIKAGTVASNNGSDGTDRGAFGGLSPSTRYTLSGLAPIPVIYEISTSGVAGPAGLTITIKAKTVK